MSGDPLGLAALNAGFLVVGGLLLWAAGFIRSRTSAFRWAGLAVFVGWTVTALATSFALMAGASLSVWLVVVLWGLLAGGALLAAPRVPALVAPARRETGATGWAIAAAGALGAIVFLAMLLRRALASGGLAADVMTFWFPKAKSVYFESGFDVSPGGFASFDNPDYPPLLPVSEAVTFEFMGTPDVLLAPAQHWVLAVAFVGALAGLGSARVRPAVLWPSLASLVLLPNFEELVGSALGDEALAELVSLAVLATALWLLGRERHYAALAALFLAAATLTKSEGFVLSAALVVALLVGTRGRAFPVASRLLAAALCAYLPWRIWLKANDVGVTSTHYRLADIVDPRYMWDRLFRLEYAAERFPGYLFDPSKWLLVLPLTFLLSAALWQRRRPLAVFPLVVVALMFCAYLFVYWAGSVDIYQYLDATGDRISAPFVLACAALFPLLLAEALRRRD